MPECAIKSKTCIHCHSHNSEVHKFTSPQLERERENGVPGSGSSVGGSFPVPSIGWVLGSPLQVQCKSILPIQRLSIHSTVRCHRLWFWWMRYNAICKRPSRICICYCLFVSAHAWHYVYPSSVFVLHLNINLWKVSINLDLFASVFRWCWRIQQDFVQQSQLSQSMGSSQGLLS